MPSFFFLLTSISDLPASKPSHSPNLTAPFALPSQIRAAPPSSSSSAPGRSAPTPTAIASAPIMQRSPAPTGRPALVAAATPPAHPQSLDYCKSYHASPSNISILMTVVLSFAPALFFFFCISCGCCHKLS